MLFNPAGLLLPLLELIQNGLSVKLQGILGNMSFCEMCGFIFIKHNMTPNGLNVAIQIVVFILVKDWSV